MTSITRHGEKQMKKRLGFSKKLLDRAAKIAFEKGLKHNELKGKLSKYVSKKFLTNRTANNIRIHSRFVWIFTKAKLITVYPLPSEFHRIEDRLKLKRNEHAEEAS